MATQKQYLHPQVAVHIPVDFGRKPVHKRTLPEEEETNPRDKQWKRQREAAFIRQRMWAGEPIPTITKQRKHASVTTAIDPHTESDGSSTEEWPSPTTSDTETVPLNSSCIGPLHQRCRLEHPNPSTPTAQLEQDILHQPTVGAQTIDTHHIRSQTSEGCTKTNASPHRET